MPIQLTDPVRDVLNRSTITALTVQLPNEQLERKLYIEVNKVLEAAGGKWDRRTRSHVFTSDPRAKLGLAMETGQIVSKKQDLQAFYTSAEIAELVVDGLPQWTPEAMRKLRVLEPSAGHGALLKPLLAAGVWSTNVTCYDIDEEAVAVLNGLGFRAQARDFLEVLDPALVCVFDAVVMNPPFTKGQAVAHVTHALRFPRIGGHLVAIMPPTWQTSRKKADIELRKLLDRDYRWSVEKLPEGAFKEAGTAVQTVLLRAERLR